MRERPSKPQGEMILTEPAKVRRPAQAESWKPIFKDEPNEAALDLFMHSKYDRKLAMCSVTEAILSGSGKKSF